MTLETIGQHGSENWATEAGVSILTCHGVLLRVQHTGLLRRDDD